MSTKAIILIKSTQLLAYVFVIMFGNERTLKEAFIQVEQSYCIVQYHDLVSPHMLFRVWANKQINFSTSSRV